MLPCLPCLPCPMHLPRRHASRALLAILVGLVGCGAAPVPAPTTIVLPPTSPVAVGPVMPAPIASPPRSAPPSRGKMVSLPGGTYAMGDRGDTVIVQPFALDQTEVTVAAYSACVDAKRCTEDHVHEWSLDDGGTLHPDAACNYGAAGADDHPMNCVDWSQAASFCRVQRKRLPTEEEMEWAARGGNEGWVFPWGDAPPDDTRLCWSGVTQRRQTCQVGSTPAGDTPGGIEDLAGNVAEWTSSPFGDGTNAWVTKGGGWNYDLPQREGLRAASRHRHAPADRVDRLGFRCAL
jgi:formylglycine-generating enzyme